MSETKQYRLQNKEPGPRGVETLAHGLVMVQPTAAGAYGPTVTLTEDEAKNAKRQGLTLKPLRNGTGIKSTDNRPAAGHIDPNAPDAAEKLGGKPSKSDKDGEDDGASKPLSKMSRAELDEVVKAENVELNGADTNAAIVEAIEKHRAKA